MNIQEVRNKLLSARETPFRNVFSSYVGSDFLPTLDDQESAFIFVASKEKIVEPTEIMRRLSQGCRNHFEALLKMKTVHGFFFDHFALFLKLHDDGLLIGFGADEMYYVVATWDQDGHDLWKPVRDLYKRPVTTSG